MTQRHCSPPLSTRRRRVAARGGWMPRSNIAITPYHIAPRCAGQGGGNVARPYCAERRRSGVATTLVGVSQAGRCLVPAPFRYGTRHNRTYDATARARDRRSHHLAFVRTAPPLSDPESRAPTLRDRARESGCAGGVSLRTTTRRTARSQKTRGDPRGQKGERERKRER